MAKSGVEKILEKWRGLIKSKKRMIISLEEIMQQKIESLRPWIYPETEPLDGWQFRQFKYTNKQQRIWVDDAWRPIGVGQTWGGPDMSAYFRCKAALPQRFAGKKVALKVYFSGDGLLRVNGRAYHGLDPFRDTVLMAECAQGSEEFDLEAECYILWHFGEGETKTLECSHWAVVDQEMSDAYWDLKAAFNVLLIDGLDGDLVAHLRDVFHRATKFIDQNCRDAAEVGQDVDAFFRNARGQAAPWADAQVFQTRIRRNVRLAEAPSFGQSIFQYAPDSHGAEDYQRLAAEVVAGGKG